MMLLTHAVAHLRAYVRSGDEEAAVALFYRVVGERTDAMHQRAQTAESRAHKAERDFDRFVKDGSR